MFAKSSIETKFEEKILSSLTELDQHTADSREYADILERLAKLHKLKVEEAQSHVKITETLHKLEADSKLQLPSMDNALVVAANLLGILWMTRYERQNVIHSKALGFVMRPR